MRLRIHIFSAKTLILGKLNPKVQVCPYVEASAACHLRTCFSSPLLQPGHLPGATRNFDHGKPVPIAARLRCRLLGFAPRPYLSLPSHLNPLAWPSLSKVCLIFTSLARGWSFFARCQSDVYFSWSSFGSPGTRSCCCADRFYLVLCLVQHLSTYCLH